MKIIAIPTLDGSDCIYVTREGVSIIENTGCVQCMHMMCDNIDCCNCQLENKLTCVRLDELEHYIYNCETDAGGEKTVKEVLGNE